MKGAIIMLKKNKNKQERKEKRRPIGRPVRFENKTHYTRKKGRTRDEWYKAEGRKQNPKKERVWTS